MLPTFLRDAFIRLNKEETKTLADQLMHKLNKDPLNVQVLIPLRGWSEADRDGGPLYDPDMNRYFSRELYENLDTRIRIHETDHHINEPAFATAAAQMMNQMIQDRQ